MDRTMDAAAALLARDLATVEQLAPVTYEDGYTPRGATLDPTGRRGTSGPSSGPDLVPAPRYAIGVGNDRSRLAFTAAAAHMLHALHRGNALLALVLPGYRAYALLQPEHVDPRVVAGRTRALRIMAQGIERAWVNLDGLARLECRRGWAGGQRGDIVDAVVPTVALAATELLRVARPETPQRDAPCSAGCGRMAYPGKGGRCSTCAQRLTRARRANRTLDVASAPVDVL